MLKRFTNFVRSRLKKYILEEIWLEDYIKLGMKVGKNCSIQPGVTFDYSHCWLINIGNNVTIAPQAYILAHDASTKQTHGYTKVGNVTIEDNVFIGARAVIMPGVFIGKHSVVASGSVVTKDVPENSIVAGNPAKVISSIDAYREKTRELIDNSKIYDFTYTIKGKVTASKKEKMYSELKSGIGFVD
ncbi:acyltransferase [Cytobacillus kochii]|uniref:acyltransferase n=1 Tax=Cytobacillus kochii TaxID=859143 RepID=UPI001CD3B145|nr:acyltransferase [Cytobacillus kochii]MCA1025653.1 acyltransferase [Cytobacillus kochii]